MSSPFAFDYDLAARRVVRPRGRDFDLVITPRYEHHYLVEAYEALTADLLVSLLTSRRLFVDVGAHYGFFSLLAATRHPHLEVLALEPVEQSHALLAEGIERNGVGARVQARRLAASDSDGAAPFYISSASDNCSFYPHPATPVLNRVEVAAVALDSLLLGREGADRAVLKIDTDGHELAVLAGLEGTLAAASDLRLIVELNPKMQRLAGHAPEELIDRLQRLGFEVFLIDDHERRYLRLTDPGSWPTGCTDQGYANLYAAPRKRALSVALFGHSSHLSGAERTLLSNVTALVQDQGAVCTVVLPAHGPLRERLEALGAATLVAPLPWWCQYPGESAAEEMAPSLAAGAQRLLAEVLPRLAASRPQVVESMTLVAPWGALAAALLDLPHVWNVCEYGERDHGLRFCAPLPEVCAVIAAASNRVLTPCEGVRQALFPQLGADRCEVHGRWFDIPLGGPAATAPATGRLRIGVFANLQPGKDQRTVIEALAILRRRGIDAELLLAGHADAPYRRELEQRAAELDVSDRVGMPGFLEQALAAMATVDVVVSAAPHEAFGRSTVEAAVEGRPVVLARGSGPCELLPAESAALWFEPRDPAALADQLARLFADPTLRRRLVAAARAILAERCSREHIGGRRFELLRGLVDTSNPLTTSPIGSLLLSVARQLGRELDERTRRLAAAEQRASELEVQAAATRQESAAQAAALQRQLEAQAESRQELQAQVAALRQESQAQLAALRQESAAQATALQRQLEGALRHAAERLEEQRRLGDREIAGLRAALAGAEQERTWVVGTATWRARGRLLAVPGVARAWRALRALLPR